MYISQRVREVTPAPIRKLWLDLPEDADIISFGQGVPYFPPPPALFRNVAELVQDPASHRYAPDEGLIGIREALTNKLSRENGIELGTDWARRLIVTAGANQAFVNALGELTG